MDVHGSRRSHAREHVYASRHIQECNWLQALEGGFDPVHLAFLHVGTAGGDTPVVPSQHKVVPKDFGFIAATGRDLPGGETRWTVNAMLMPFHKVFSTSLRAAHAWVPIDDENTMLYSVEYLTDRPLEKKDMERIQAHTSIHTENHPGTDHAIHNKANDYLVDRALQASGKSFTGMRGLGIQDCAIQESMGPVADRTVEHLGISDTTVIRIRQLLMKTLDDLEAGRPLPGMQAEAYRVRSCRMGLPTGQPVEDVVDAAIRYGRLEAAE
jgi:phthalate 4,5-dioxygenase